MDSQSNLIHINYIKYLKNLDIRQLELEIINYYSLLNTDSFENDLILRKINIYQIYQMKK